MRTKAQGPVERHSQQLQFPSPFNQLARHADVAADGVSGVLGEDELYLLVCRALLPRLPSSRPVRLSSSACSSAELCLLIVCQALPVCLSSSACSSAELCLLV